MARNPKCRKVCQMPSCCRFNSLSDSSSDIENEVVIMSVEEYETIRLIDYTGLTQEECASQMHISRTTVQRIYNDARNKLSIFLVEGTRLNISGGSYELCSKGSCHKDSRPCKVNPILDKK
ncbi:MAG: DUF134 domain-containing protein [Proteocatella sp.]